MYLFAFASLPLLLVVVDFLFSAVPVSAGEPFSQISTTEAADPILQQSTYQKPVRLVKTHSQPLATRTDVSTKQPIGLGMKATSSTHNRVCKGKRGRAPGESASSNMTSIHLRLATRERDGSAASDKNMLQQASPSLKQAIENIKDNQTDVLHTKTEYPSTSQS
ncbi:hypothetical protein CCM_02001 [Cordyceps militaris CM01]|uniref:Uncharacterized protein n=1 Tax=Cordyceps militaris (strain CM01) TaxID=983644 RepID=G3JC14_CORMM|nr:uncharacterized protein CCM_02001 [Cordyceps militaris CM01]EGX93732.1 hypothetical protein CCM_02001 [Cordyceps militaris CM01]